MHDPDPRNAPSLFVTALRQFTKLMQDEVALVRAELSRNLSRAGAGLGMLAGAAIIALVGLNVLASALVAYIAASGLGLGAAALIVGGALLLIAVILAVIGKRRVSPDALVPRKSADTVRRDLKMMKEAGHA